MLVLDNVWLRGGPEEVVQGVEVPDVELVVKGATEAHADQVSRPQGQQDL